MLHNRKVGGTLYLFHNKLIIHLGRMWNSKRDTYPLTLSVRWKGKSWTEVRWPLFGFSMQVYKVTREQVTAYENRIQGKTWRTDGV